jgi:hypothetical protein
MSLVAGLFGLMTSSQGAAAEPATGSISPETPETRFESGPFLPTSACISFTVCDSYELTVTLPADYAFTHPQAMVRIALGWDFKLDLFVFDLIDLDTGEVASGATSSSDLGSQTFYVPAGAGTRRFRLDVVPAAPSNSVVIGRVGLFDGLGDLLVPNPVGLPAGNCRTKPRSCLALVMSC